MRQRYGLSVELDDDGEPLPFEERIAMVVFRSVRELLINVAKHANTDTAILSLKKLACGIQVGIEDHGKGFEPAFQSRDVEAGHFGLFSIRERVEYLGGTFSIQSAPGKGARICLTMPIPAEAADAQAT
jgi:signal transduction histidine kinase